jgi:hypothetical protein
MTSTRTAGEWNRKNNYLNHLKTLLKKFYLLEDKSSLEYRSLNAEIKGFLDAGLIARVATEKDLQKFIDLQRYGIKGNQVSSDNRVLETPEEGAWESYEEPSYRRKGPRATGVVSTEKVRKTAKESE